MADNFVILMAEITALSVSQEWSSVVHEWYIDHIERLDPGTPPETCLCTHSPIMELCFLRNRLNGLEAMVGNVCVNNFMGIQSELIFSGFRRIAVDRLKAINGALAAYAHQSRLITDWEYEFCLNTVRKRVLSPKQSAKRIEINERLIAKIIRQKKPPNASTSTAASGQMPT